VLLIVYLAEMNVPLSTKATGRKFLLNRSIYRTGAALWRRIVSVLAFDFRSALEIPKYPPKYSRKGNVMPDSKLNLQISRSTDDLKSVRLQGASKSLEQMTIAELVQMRPGGATEAADSYSVNAFTDNVSVSTSSLVDQIGQIAKERAMRSEVEDARLTNLRERLGTPVGRVTTPR
jgi:hypothetical protein